MKKSSKYTLEEIEILAEKEKINKASRLLLAILTADILLGIIIFA